MTGVGTFSGNVIGGTLTYEDVQNVDSVGVITTNHPELVDIGSDGAAVVYYGDASNLDGVVSGIELKEGGTSRGTSLTVINFESGATVTTGSAGVSTITIAAGITTTALEEVVELNLRPTSSWNHELSLTAGITTISCTGGTFGESHSVVLVQPTTGIGGFGGLLIPIWCSINVGGKWKELTFLRG